MDPLSKGGNGWKRKRDPFSHFMATLERHPALIPSISLAREMCYCTPLWEWEMGKKEGKTLCQWRYGSKHPCARKKTNGRIDLGLACHFWNQASEILSSILNYRYNCPGTPPKCLFFWAVVLTVTHTPVRRSGFWPLEGKSGKSPPPTQMGDISGHSTLLIYIFTTCVFSAVSSEQFFCSFLHKLHFLN